MSQTIIPAPKRRHCECGAIATTRIWNGRDILDCCEACYQCDESIWMEAVMAFSMEVHSAGLDGTRYQDLHQHFDPNASLDRYLNVELECRGQTREGKAWLGLVKGAQERYDEWYTSDPAYIITSLADVKVGDRVLRPHFHTVEIVTAVDRNRNNLKVLFASGHEWTCPYTYQMRVIR